MRRVLASVMLAALVVSLAAPLLAGGTAVSERCPLAPGGGAPQLDAAMGDGACEHTAPGPCVAALGCVTVAPAIRPTPTVLVTSTRLIVLGAAPTPQAGDLYRTGPPTPPPNHS